MVHIDSPASFWVQIHKYKSQLDDLVKQMVEYYSNTEQDSVTDSVKQGTYYAAFSTEHETWYRALTKSEVNSTENTVNVHYIDYGNEETVSTDALKVLTHEFSSLLCTQAVQCYLCDVIPSGDDWSPESIDLLYNATSKDELEVEVKEAKDGDGRCYGVNLLDMGEHELVLSQILLDL